jgi:hypothetical protein
MISRRARIASLALPAPARPPTKLIALRWLAGPIVAV